MCLFCWTERLDNWFIKLYERSEAMFVKLIEAIAYHWQHNTLICIGMVILFFLWVIWFIGWGYDMHRRKSRQRKWRAHLRKEQEERMSER